MVDLFDEIHSEQAGDLFDEIHSEQKQTDKPEEFGPTEAFVNKALNEVSFGADVPIAGLIGTASEVASDPSKLLKLEALKEAFYRAKEDRVKNLDEMYEQQPMASMGGTLVGGVGSMFIPGAIVGRGLKAAQGVGKLGSIASKAQKVADVILPSTQGLSKIKKLEGVAKLAAKAGKVNKSSNYALKALGETSLYGAREAAKIGGLKELISGEDRLLEGELGIEDAAKSALLSGAVGGLLAPALGAAGGIISEAPGASALSRAFKQGVNRQSISEDAVNEKIGSTAQTLGKEIQKIPSELNQIKNQVQQDIREAEESINASDIAKLKQELLSDKVRHYPESKILLDEIAPFEGKSPELEKKLIELKHEVRGQDYKYSNLEDRQRVNLDEQTLKRLIKSGKEVDKFIESEANLPEHLMSTESNPTFLVRKNQTTTPAGEVKEQILTANISKPEYTIQDPVYNPIDNITELVAIDKTGKYPKIPKFIEGDHTPSGKDLSSLKIDDLIDLKNRLDRFSKISLDQNIPAEVKNLATKYSTILQNKLKDKLATLKPEIRKHYEDISNILDFQNIYSTIGNAKSQVVKAVDQENMAANAMSKFLRGSGDLPLSDPTSLTRSGINKLKQVNPELGEKLEREVVNSRELAELSGIAETTAPAGGLKQQLGAIGGLALKASNLAGRAVSPIVKPLQNIKLGEKLAKLKELKKPENDLVSMSNKIFKDKQYSVENLFELAKSTKAPQFIITQLERAANSNSEIQKRAAIQALMQNSPFRKWFTQTQEQKPSE